MTRTPAKLPFTAKQLVAVAAGEDGYVEQGNNRTKYGKARGLDGLMWCGMFVWWLFLQLGWDLRKHGIQNPESTNAFDAQMAAAGWQRVPQTKIQLGDVLLYDFGDVDGSGPDTANDNDHVGVAAGRVRREHVDAWEGNTSPDEYGSQRNGGQVCKKRRSITLIRRAYRPPYSTAAQLRAAKKAAPAGTVKPAAPRRAAASKPSPSRKLTVPVAAAIAAGTLATGGTLATTSSPPPSPCTTQASPSPTPSPRSAARPTYTRILLVRAKPLTGPDVAAVQAEVGVPVDRDYGRDTGIAVRAWKKALGLPATGRWTKAAARAAGWTVR